MTTPRSAGRPKAISREMLEEAACELFLERGYADTSVVDITQRAGVSRATFFNYVDSKSDLLWASVDDAIAGIARTLGYGANEGPGGGAEAVREVLLEAADTLAPGVAVLAIANAEAMGVVAELVLTGAQRQARLARTIAEHFRRSGEDGLRADVLSRAYAGAFFAALEAWAKETPGSKPFSASVRDALEVLR